MVTTLPTCGNCRRNNAEYQRETVLETDEEMEPDEENPFEITIGMAPPARNTLVVMKLIEYRLKRRYIHTHYRRSHFWPEIPYEADPSIWLNYELFTRLFPSNPLYVHGRVMLPTSATSAMRHAVYRMFMYNTPFTVFEITNPFAFRLLFIRNLTTNTLRVDNLWFMPHSGCPPLYPDLLFCCSLSLEDVLHRRERERRRREAIDTIHEYRDRARPFETHNSLTSRSWSVLSYPIPPTVWFQYYREMDSFLRTVGNENRMLYIHGVVCTFQHAVVS